MPLRSLRALAAIFGVMVASCQSGDEHPPAVSDDCTSHCDPIGTTPGGQQPDAGKKGGTGGARGDSSVSVTPLCVKDPTFGIVLCDRSDFCPGVVVDQTSLQGCGFVQTADVATVACICNGTFLCPVSSTPTCSSLPGFLSLQTSFTICNQVATQKCVDLGAVPLSHDGGKCTSLCIQQCGGFPACLAQCGC